MQGYVKFYNLEKGFGFITPDDGGPNVFAHYSAIVGAFKELSEGQRVEFDLVGGSDKPRASNINPI
ncbi:cold shock protein (beta-ribbon, CspA family) [Luteibacter sp. UNCMF331Sha3.1]|uniref:cold-shock protein n=1 Tax=Luteibacter sp. UNCMF331Sha3.1 TaxID=1502760 RepID=UPI0008BB3FE1|nr:cold-shock protein [Luteibacter sp. UNCMF331Sha3.1]SEM23018.1 cold shock protein (beta-ribbon, CspA family) [Luteibacter sp. UNCMF331Sha3.1]